MTESQEMTVIERAARALWQDRKDAGDYSPADTWEDAPESDQAACRRKARAVLQAIREPMSAWLAHQIEHGHAPDGYPVEMTPEYTWGRISAFQATKAMIDAALTE